MRWVLLSAALALACGNTPALEDRLRDGDIIFHESRSSQSRAIQLATKSRYSHLGIVYRDRGRWYVFEAVQPVKLTPLQEWTARGEIYKHGAGVEIGRLQRLREFDLSHPAVRAKMRERYGNDLPVDEPVISPAAMFDSNELIEVARR